MCGIAGAWWQKPASHDSWPSNLRQRIDRALHALRLRGPDDSGEQINDFGNGTLALLHKRLSVIDLSSGGHQPKSSEDGRFTLVYNGEIYNYRELKSQLAGMGLGFQTQSDTEVLLQAWRVWGTQCLTRLEGMFAFVVFDRQLQTLTCARDAFGIKPLYYSTAADEFAFASVVPAIEALRTEGSRLNWQRAYDYLVHADYDSQPQGFVEGIEQLPPAHWIEVDLRTGQVGVPQCWWTPPIVENDRITFQDAAAQVREQFLKNIRLHMRSDVRLGAALSGGIDSSAVVCAMRKVAPDAPLHTFSFIADDTGLSEERWVDLVNADVGALSHKVHATGAQMLSDLDDMLAAQGEPFGSTSIYAQYRVFKQAKEAGITVTLDGQGADEMLAGYIGYPGYRLQSMLESGHWGDALRFGLAWGNQPQRSTTQAIMYMASAMLPANLELMARRLWGRSATPNWLDVPELQARGVHRVLPWTNQTDAPTGRKVMGQLAQALTRRGLPGLLRHGDRNAMRFSVESRVPFLTLPMAQLCLSLPEHYLISNTGETKHVFRAAMRGLVPDAILDRQDKIGFATPEQKWLRQAAPSLRSWIREAADVPLLKHEAVLTQFDQLLQGQKGFSWQAWRWVNFVRWYRVSGIRA